ncbi:MAG: hypothetical protein ABMA64_16475 [Myxococcota bacterium]
MTNWFVVGALGITGSTLAWGAPPPGVPPNPTHYELWASDQSNSVAGSASLGVNGSWLWIWDSEDVLDQLGGGPAAAPLPCAGTAAPCDVNLLFPSSLVEMDEFGQPTGNTRPATGRLHSSFIDPQQKYALLSFFSPGGGMVGIVDADTKEAVGLFRAIKTATGLSNHMSFWRYDGLAILVCNLDGKIVERIDVTRDVDGNIVDLTYAMDAAIGVGKSQIIVEGPKVYVGTNSAGNPMLGTVQSGNPDFGDLTPNGKCKENGCPSGPNGSMGGRTNNAILCPIPANDNALVYVTLAGGGLLVVDSSATPMAVVGEYGNQVINGAGCAGAQANGRIYLDSGVSASAAGLTQSTFGVYSVDHAAFPLAPAANAENVPAPQLVIKGANNTATNGNLVGPASNLTGQIPGITTRRDSHGVVATTDEKYVHVGDRIGNKVEVIQAHGVVKSIGSYDLVSLDGKGSGVGPCGAASVSDSPGLVTNDVAPDLMARAPDGDYLFVALRGPTPITAPHAAQGSCPGVGVIELLQGGKSGKLVAVLRTTNTQDNAPYVTAGGHPYTGTERSDTHFVDVRRIE